jgi:hypothetical protein
MAARTWYTKEIQQVARYTFREAELIEHIMRTHLLHSTLDWLSPEQFVANAREAAAILREFYEAGDLPEPWRQFLAGEDCIL